MLYERVARPALFRLGGGDAEAAHERTLRALTAVGRRPWVLAALRRMYQVSAPRTVFGIEFPNPVGLAAGMDKDGVALAAWPALGFGFVEVGTVTRHAQPGNERPRLFRLPDREAIVNRMGFNNRGAAALAARLAATRRAVPLGVSLGKSRATALDDAVADYRASFMTLRGCGDYFVVNVSSPNTPGLRRLQDRGHLDALLQALVTGERPILVKISPDLTDHAVAEVLDVCTRRGAAGVIATNTAAAGVIATNTASAGAGGLSGRPLAARAREVVALVAKESPLPVIGVGGIMDPDGAARMFDAGASLVQLYTGFVYHGPSLVRAIARAGR